MYLINITTMILLLAGSSYQSISNIEGTSITIQNLSKKWNLEKYKVSFFEEAPEEKEKNDYIHLKSDMTFSSISEGAFEIGTWRLDVKKKRIYLSEKGAEGELVFIINNLSSQKLVLIIDDPADSDAQYLKIHFKN